MKNLCQDSFLALALPRCKGRLGTRAQTFLLSLFILIAVIIAFAVADRWFVRKIISDNVFPYFSQSSYWRVSHGASGMFGAVVTYEALLHFPAESIHYIKSQGFHQFDLSLSLRGVSDADSSAIKEQYDCQSRLFGTSPTLGMTMPIALMYPNPAIDLFKDEIYFSCSDDSSSRFAIIINATRGIAWVSYTPGLK